MNVDGAKAKATTGAGPKPEQGEAGKGFSKVLEKKAGEKGEERRKRKAGEDRERAAGETGDDPFAAAGREQAPVPMNPVLPSVEQAREAAPVAEPLLIRNLVDEITARVDPSGTAMVDIQFNSNTLQGLRVQVVKAGEHVSVRFASASEEVRSLLKRNVDSLTASLEAKGFHVGAIAVQRVEAASQAQPAPAGERTSGGGAGGDGRSRGGQGRSRR